MATMSGWDDRGSSLEAGVVSLYKVKPSHMTVEEYLATEESSPARHEYVDGQLFAMSGASRRHNLIAINTVSILRPHLKGGRCRVYMSDVKVRVEATNSFYYPDVMVSCDAFDSKNVFTTSPCLIFEILSLSTATIDRREKLIAYRQLTSLREYVIVHQRSRRVELYRKNKDERWELIELAAGDKLVLESIPGKIIEFPIEELYVDVSYPRQGKPHLEVHEDSDEEYLSDEEPNW